MRTELKNDLSYNKALLILSSLCILSGCLSFVFGELVTMAVSGLLAAILVFESGHRRIYSIAVSIALIVINIAMLLSLKTVYSLWSILSIIVALIISYAYKKGITKFDAALIITGVIAVFTVGSFVVAGMIAADEFTLEASINLYKRMYEIVREEFSQALVDIYSQINQSIGAEDITLANAGELLDSMLNLLISVLAIVSFFMCGVALKVFSAVFTAYSQHKDTLLWRFNPPAFFGHFYMILVVIYFISSNSDGIFAISCANLYLIFMWIYAYVGAGIVYRFLAKNKSRVFAGLVLAAAIIFLSSFAMQILAMIGAFYTSRQQIGRPDDNR